MTRSLAAKPGSGFERQASFRQQVAAVCYRSGAGGIEFLLVRTRSGRWIFPKGGVEEGLTQAQSAALEAFEEAGVHGRIEEMPFSRYRLAKSSGKKPGQKKSSAKKSSASTVRPGEETVTAHLCEVSHIEAPQELYRMPTWFSAEKAKRRLRANRNSGFGEELAGIVDRAVSRIRRLAASAGGEFANDALRKVRFEASENEATQGARGTTVFARQRLLESRGVATKPALEVQATSGLRRRKTEYVQ